jgi:hypothetical protein
MVREGSIRRFSPFVKGIITVSPKCERSALNLRLERLYNQEDGRQNRNGRRALFDF